MVGAAPVAAPTCFLSELEAELNRIRIILSVFFAVMVSLGAARVLDGQEGKQAVQYFRSEAFAEAGLPFSDAVRVGDLVFVSGTIGADPERVRDERALARSARGDRVYCDGSVSGGSDLEDRLAADASPRVAAPRQAQDRDR